MSYAGHYSTAIATTLHSLVLLPDPRSTKLRVEGEGGTDLVGGVAGGGVVELGGVEGKAERGLDTGAESLGVAEDKDTSVVDLGLDEGGVVEVSLGADLDGDVAGGGLGVVDSAGASLNVLRDTVVVRGREGREVLERVEGDGVLGSRVADGGGVAAEGTGLDVVRSLTTDEEAVVADNGVSGEGGALRKSQPTCLRVIALLEAGWLPADRGPTRQLTLKTSATARVWTEGCL